MLYGEPVCISAWLPTIDTTSFFAVNRTNPPYRLSDKFTPEEPDDFEYWASLLPSNPAGRLEFVMTLMDPRGHGYDMDPLISRDEMRALLR